MGCVCVCMWTHRCHPHCTDSQGWEEKSQALGDAEWLGGFPGLGASPELLSSCFPVPFTPRQGRQCWASILRMWASWQLPCLLPSHPNYPADSFPAGLPGLPIPIDSTLAGHSQTQQLTTWSAGLSSSPEASLLLPLRCPALSWTLFVL